MESKKSKTIYVFTIKMLKILVSEKHNIPLNKIKIFDGLEISNKNSNRGDDAKDSDYILQFEEEKKDAKNGK